MAAAAKYVTQEEFQRLTIRVEVLSVDVHRLGQAVGDIAEDLAELRTEVTELREELHSEISGLRAEMNSRFDAMGKMIADGHAALLSAVLAIGPR